MPTEDSMSDITTVIHSMTMTNATQVSSRVNTTIAVVYLLLSMSVMISNGVIVFVFTKIRHLNLPTLLILNFMACCDFLMGLYFLIFAMPSAFLGSFAYSDSCNEMAAILFTVLAGQNALNMVIAVVDRYIAVYKPLAYVRIVTTKKLYVVFPMSVVLSLCRMAIIAFPDRDYYYNNVIAVCVTDFNTLPAAIASVCPFILLSVLMVLSYGMFRKLKRGRLIFPEGGLRQGVRSPQMVTIRMMIMGLSYIPIIMCVFWNIVSNKDTIPTWLLQLGMVGLFSNSLWNVFIYSVTYRPFREALMGIFCREYLGRLRQAEIHAMISESGLN